MDQVNSMAFGRVWLPPLGKLWQNENSWRKVLATLFSCVSKIQILLYGSQLLPADSVENIQKSSTRPQCFLRVLGTVGRQIPAQFPTD